MTVTMVPMAQDDVGKSATPVTPATRLMDILKARRKLELGCPAPPVGDLQEPLAVAAAERLYPEQPATVGVLNTVANAVRTSPGLSVRLCLGCGNPFTPSDDNKVYCRAKCWNTPKAALKPAG